MLQNLKIFYHERKFLIFFLFSVDNKQACQNHKPYPKLNMTNLKNVGPTNLVMAQALKIATSF